MAARQGQSAQAIGPARRQTLLWSTLAWMINLQKSNFMLKNHRAKNKMTWVPSRRPISHKKPVSTFLIKTKNVSYEDDRLKCWNSTFQPSWYIRHLRLPCLFYISFTIIWCSWTKPTASLLILRFTSFTERRSICIHDWFIFTTWARYEYWNGTRIRISLRDAKLVVFFQVQQDSPIILFTFPFLLTFVPFEQRTKKGVFGRVHSEAWSLHHRYRKLR